MRFDRYNLPDHGDFKPYRKVGTTMIAGPFQPPVEVVTQEGEKLIADGPAYIAVDAEGHPYPIKASVFEKTYVQASAPPYPPLLG